MKISEEAIDEWKKIFGSGFPSLKGSNKSYGKKKPALADYSHCDIKMAFKYIDGIDAYIYTNKRKD